MKNTTKSNIFWRLWACLCRLVRFDWMPEPAFVQIQNIYHDDVMVKSAYDAVKTGSTASWVEDFVRDMAKKCKTKNGRRCCEKFLSDHLEWKSKVLLPLSNSPVLASEERGS